MNLKGYFSPLNDPEICKKRLKEIAQVCYVFTGLGIVFSFLPVPLPPEFRVTLRFYGLIYLVLGLFLHFKQSRIAAVLLILTAADALVSSLLNMVHHPGTNSAVSLLFFLYSIRGVQAAFAYHKLKEARGEAIPNPKSLLYWIVILICLIIGSVFIGVVFRYKNDKAAQGYINSGLDYIRQDKYDQAISEYNKAIAISPNNAECYNYRGFAYDELKNFPQAISDYTKAIEINSKSSDAYKGHKYVYSDAYDGRGYVYIEQDYLDQAFADLNKATEIDPNDGQPYYSRGFAYFKEKEYDKAWVEVHKTDAIGFQPGKEESAFLDELKKASNRDK